MTTSLEDIYFLPEQVMIITHYVGLRISCYFPPSKINDLGSKLAHTFAINWRIRCFFLKMPTADEVTETINTP